MPLDPNALRPVATPTVSGGRDELALSSHMRGVYNYMAGGLAVSGAVAYYAYVSGLYPAIAKTPLIWLVLLAPLAMVMFLSFRIEKMSLATARATYWIYAAVMGVSLAGIFLMYSGESISRVFFISAGTFAGISFYGFSWDVHGGQVCEEAQILRVLHTGAICAIGKFVPGDAGKHS